MVNTWVQESDPSVGESEELEAIKGSKEKNGMSN